MEYLMVGTDGDLKRRSEPAEGKSERNNRLAAAIGLTTVVAGWCKYSDLDVCFR
jgi:hypothetical protein